MEGEEGGAERGAAGVGEDVVIGCEITNERVFNASREAVFDAFADESKWPLWWGPKGWTNEPGVRELRPGGAWRFLMRGPDGAVFPMEKRFVDVARPERVVVDHLNGVHTFRMTMMFEEVAGGTRVVWRMVFDQDEGEGMRRLIAGMNEENLDRLGGFLERDSFNVSP